jgi:hypothetical protein
MTSGGNTARKACLYIAIGLLFVASVFWLQFAVSRESVYSLVAVTVLVFALIAGFSFWSLGRPAVEFRNDEAAEDSAEWWNAVK